MIKYETDSRRVKPGQTFIAISGLTVDGHSYINSAIENGATKLIVEKKVDTNIEYEMVENTKEYLKEHLVNEYSNLFKDMKFIGVTGTNGKTTTCYLMYQMLNKLGIKTAYIGTIGFYYGDTKKELSNTTPDLLTLYNLILEAKENGCTHIVMEVSSHSLDQERIAGITFEECAFTNLTQDHLDYHKTMENYLNAKLKILNYIKLNGSMIINNDDPYGKYFINENINNITFGIDNSSNLNIKNIEYTPSNTTINFEYKNINYIVTTNLTSKFNVYNYITCLLLLNNLGYEINKIIEITNFIYPPKGRCEIINLKNGVAVIDYAHTPDAVEKVINSFTELKENKIITIIGCGGDRDPIKRPIMGDISCKLSDYVIFTSDNPRTEDPKKILDDITSNLKYNNFDIVIDRKEAIIKGLELMEENDILLVLGKGHEDYQIIGHDKIHFDDHEVIENWKNNA